MVFNQDEQNGDSVSLFVNIRAIALFRRIFFVVVLIIFDDFINFSSHK